MIPTLDAVDSFPALMREGYPFVSRRCDRLRSDVFLTRFAGKPTYCALALLRHPEWRERFVGGDESDLRPFV